MKIHWLVQKLLWDDIYLDIIYLSVSFLFNMENILKIKKKYTCILKKMYITYI
jgi:hypothetical protein